MKQNGQVILIVLIVSALIMTIGLSISRKTVVETKIDTDEELLKQAFNTAESGIDYYLGTGRTDYTPPDNTKKVDVSVSALGTGITALDFNEYSIENNPAIFWMVGHDVNGDIDYGNFYQGPDVNLCVGVSFSGSLKVDLYYKTGTSFGIARQGFFFTNRPASEVGFVDKSGATQDVCSRGSKAIKLNLVGGSVPLLLSISPIWSGTKISLIGSANFPSQGSEISSVGRAGDLTTGVNRKVTVQNRYRVPPFLFEAITAGNDVLNN